MKNSALRNIVFSIIAGICIMGVYFIITIKTAAPTRMKLFLPKSSDSKQQTINPKTTINLLLYNDNSVFVYQGTNIAAGKIYNENDSSLNTWLQQIKRMWPDTTFLVLIKPGANATYKNTVDALDKMTINDIKRYAMVDISEAEQKLIDSLRKG